MLSNRYRGERNITGAIGNLSTTSPQGMSYTPQPVNIVPLPGAIGNQGPTGAAGGQLGNASFYQGPQVASAPHYIQSGPPPNVINKAPHIDSRYMDRLLEERQRLNPGVSLPPFV